MTEGVAAMVLSVRPDDQRLSWYGVVSFEHGDGWLKPWRIPFERRQLFGSLTEPDMMLSRAGMAAGVRTAFRTNSRSLALVVEPLRPDPFEVEHTIKARVDLRCDGELVESVPFAGNTRLEFAELPEGEKVLEILWPEYREVLLRSIELSDGATVAPYEDTRPKWMIYGSSNTQSRYAESPSFTWPAVAARLSNLNHFNASYGGQCHLDSAVAHMMKDIPADMIAMEVGINIWISSTLNARSLRAAMIGFILVIRDGHPTTPIAVVSSGFSPPREAAVNEAGLTLAGIRDVLKEAVEALQSAGDQNLYYVDGLSMIGLHEPELLIDELHPNPEGYKVVGQRFSEQVVPLLRR